MAGADWTDEQNDLIVADYFAMLADDIAGRRYNKAAHNRALQARIGRSKGAIEYKHQNISAVLKSIGEPWIFGYKPAFNLQAALEDAILRWLIRYPDWAARTVAHRPAAGLQEAASLYVGPPPTLSNRPPPAELEHTQRIARKIDWAASQIQNSALGRAGEKLALARERAVLAGAGRGDLADRVRWVSEAEGDGAGYDIESFEADGAPRLVEVKTTNGWERTPFHITRNELAVSEERRDSWRLLRLWDFARGPKAFELRPPLAAHVSLIATSYEARFH